MKTHCISRFRTSARRGGALLASLVLVVILTGLAAAAFAVSAAQNNEVSSAGAEMRALYMAEAGVSEGLIQMAAAIETGGSMPTSIGSYKAPIKLRRGEFWVDVTDNGDNTYTLTSRGRTSLETRGIEAVVTVPGDSVFDHAIFAGNTSGDPAYTLELGGKGSQADSIVGNIFSGGDISFSGDATIVGELLSGGTITGASGTEGVSKPVPDIKGMDYASNNDYDVKALFAASATSAYSSALGGTAYQLPEESPAHIFRLNPSDRTDETSGTDKDDYFLEDPYMPAMDFTDSYSGQKGHTITLSGSPGDPGEDGSNKVYYIDGNLWVHNKPFGRLRIDSAGTTLVTFVVKGNVYFSDDVLLDDEDQDGLAFIAIKDDAVADSGNIIMGDPRYGTIDRMAAFLYAENDFRDLNLDAAGSKKVTVAGNMTAGNHVNIERDYVKGDGSVAHSKLTVEFDDRISSGKLSLPGLPKTTASATGFEVVMWREIAND